MIQNHLTSQPLSKRLKELGVPQKSHFCWSKEFDINDYFTGEVVAEEERWLEYNEMENAKICSAFLSSELGEMYPADLQIHAYQCVVNGKVMWDCVGNHSIISGKTPPMFSDSMAESMGLMLEYLILNGLIKL